MKKLHATLTNEWLFAALVLGFWASTKLYAVNAQSLFGALG